MYKKLLAKLKIKTGYSLLLLNRPENYLEVFLKADKKARPNIHYDMVLIFVKNKADIDNLSPIAVNALKAGGIFWIAFPKKTSAIKTISPVTTDGRH